MSAHYRRLVPESFFVDTEWLAIEAAIIQGSVMRHGDNVKKLIWTIHPNAKGLWSLDAEVCR